MAQIAYLLLCHKEPDAVIAQARRLTAVGDYVSIHMDARAPAAAFQMIRSALRDHSNVTFARRVKCGWGEWSLVQATLNALSAAVEAFPRASHFYMLSGDCMPIKSAEYARAFLDRDDCDYIESHDYFESDWIRTGFKEERLIYRHYFNERKHKTLFYAAFEAQRQLGLTRAIPPDLQIKIGSQWWCLRRQTVESILDFCAKRRDVRRFFSTTWIPDETFFQTLVRHMIPEAEIRNRTPTFLLFSDYGMPVTFYNDHYDMLLSQDYLFARKISPEAHQLKARLGDLYASPDVEFQISNEGDRLYHFLTGRGREGRRFAPRFWEREASVGRGRELMVIVCKKWHVAKRLIAEMRQHTNVPMLEYLFNEDGTWLPDLGGIQATLAKRTRHRRALLRMLFDYYDTNRLVICLDPANLDLLNDFEADRSTLRVLEVETMFSDDYLVGHARRIGLAGEWTRPETVRQLLPTLRADLAFESDAIRDAQFQHFYRISQDDVPESNAKQLASFLSIAPDAARAVADAETLFAE